MRIYDGDFMVKRILERCRVESWDPAYNDARVVDGLDLDLLADTVQKIPVKEIRMRRQRLNQFYEEILVSADPMLGISFHTCLMILAHHNVINDSKSLRLEEFLRRRVRLQRVDEAVRRNTVIGFFDTLYWSRRLRDRINDRQKSRLQTLPRFEVPEIFVDQDSDNENDKDDERTDDRAVMGASGMADTARSDDEEASPMLSASSGNDVDGMAGPSSQPQPQQQQQQQHGRLLRIDTGIANNNPRPGHSSMEWSNISPSLSPNRVSPEERYGYGSGGLDQSIESPSVGTAHSRQNSSMSAQDSAQDVMESLDSSVWGESIRRSFTQRRLGQGHGHGHRSAGSQSPRSPRSPRSG